jgi:serine/threonine-protein kinase
MIPWIFASLVLGAIVTGLLFWRVISPGPTVPAAISRFVITPSPTAPLTNRSGYDVVISPDGTRIVYLGELEGRRMLYVRKLAELEAQEIPGTENAGDPFFSPDGKWVGFESGRQGKLMKILLGGGLPVAISNDVDTRGAAWGPDNNIILAKRDGLWRVPDGGGKPAEKITRDNQVCSAPRILPGGRAVIFSLNEAESTGVDEQIGVFFLETGELKILLQGTRPHYAPSGHLIFAREGALMGTRFDLERLEVTGDAVPIIEDMRWSPGAAVDFDLSENGTLVYVPGGEGAGIKRKLVWVDRQGKEEVLAVEPHDYGWLRFSPDGTRLAVGVMHPQNQDIYIYDLRREILSRLTFHPASDRYPLWTRDGLRVVFASRRDGAIFNLYWKAADGTGQVERLTTFPYLQIPRSLSPDGTKMLITERNPGSNLDISVLSLKDEQTSSPLIQTPFVESHPSVSPDGRWIAYFSDESGQDEVYVRPFPNVDQGKWQVSSDGGTEPLWIPDGRGLFYRDGQKMMKVFIEAKPTFTHGKPEVLFELDGRYLIRAPGQNHDISPDGLRFLMITEGEQTKTAPAAINVVLNWFEELKQLLPTGK